MIDDWLLDDIDAMAAGDPSNMLAAVASSGAQMREAVSVIDRAALNEVSRGDQPRNILIAGLGGSGVGGDVLRAVIGQSTPVPIISERSHSLPGWVGPMDVVVGVSCSGMTEETLSAYHDAKAKGAYCLTVSVGGKMSDLAAADGLLTYRAEGGYQPRVAFGYPVTYLFLIFAELLGQDIQSELKEVIEHVSNVEQFKSSSLAVRNFFKTNIRNKYVIVASPDMEAVAIRFAQQVQENAKLEAFVVVILEANHNVIETYYEQWASNYIFLNSGANASGLASMPVALADLLANTMGSVWAWVSPVVGIFGAFLSGSATFSRPFRMRTGR